MKIESIDKQHIQSVFLERYILRAISAENTESVVIGRNQKSFTQRNHLGVDFDYRDVCIRKLAVTPFQYRPAPQSDHGEVFRLCMETSKGHHPVGVGEHQNIRIAYGHLALDFTDPELQYALVAVFM